MGAVIFKEIKVDTMNEVKKVMLILKKDIRRNWTIYLLVLPVVIYYILFAYKPMYGIQIAFQDFKPAKGYGTDWVGLKHFINFFENPYFFRLLRNTLAIQVLTFIFGFPLPIILALLLNEVRGKKFKTITQTFMYLPHFISLVIICGMIKQFSLSTGLFNDIIKFFGGEARALLQQSNLYWGIYVASDIWQSFGWDSIIYVAALAGVDKELYDAASIDGAGKWKQTLHVTIPGIAPTVIIMLILRMGNMMSVGHEKTLLLYNEAIYDVADIIASYTYRVGMLERQYSYSTAVGMFNSVVNILLLVITNQISKKVSETSLW